MAISLRLMAAEIAMKMAALAMKAIIKRPANRNGGIFQ